MHPKSSNGKHDKSPKKETPKPTPITGADFKRAAACAGNGYGSHDIGHIELSPIGLAATNGKVLCAINAPGWPYRCFFLPQALKGLPTESLLAINGRAEFITPVPAGQGPSMAVPHYNPDEVTFPRWQKILPPAGCLQPVACLNIAQLKRALAALQAEPDSSVTLFARLDDCRSPMLLANEHGDLAVIAAMSCSDGQAYVAHFPRSVYEAFGLPIECAHPYLVSETKTENENTDAKELLLTVP